MEECVRVQLVPAPPQPLRHWWTAHKSHQNICRLHGQMIRQQHAAAAEESHPTGWGLPDHETLPTGDP